MTRVTTAQGLAGAMVAEIIAEFSDTYPEARFQLINTQGILDMRKREADIATRHGNRLSGDGVVCRKLFVTLWGSYCSPRYAAIAAIHGIADRLEELNKHRVLWFA